MDIKQRRVKKQPGISTQPTTVTPTQPKVQTPKPNVGAKQYNEQHVKMNKEIKTKRRGLMLFSFIVVFIAAAAIVVVAYFYLQSQNEEPTKSDQVLSQEGQETSKEIEELSTEIDQTLQAFDEQADFDKAQLEDSSIGL